MSNYYYSSERWLKGFEIGPRAPKDLATHHDRAFRYYSIPKEHWSDLEDKVTRLSLLGESLYLNEHAREDSRLFLDLDTNKESGQRFTNEDLENFVVNFQRRLRPRSNTNEGILQSQLLSEEDNVNRWLADPSTDPGLVIVLRSDLGEGLATYHLIWPFLIGLRVSLANSISTFLENIPGHEYVDVQCLRRGVMRSVFQEKNGHDKRPFIFHAAYDGDGGIIPFCRLFPQDDELDKRRFLMRATSIVLPFEERTFQGEDEEVQIERIPDEERRQTLDNFSAINEGFDPHSLTEILERSRDRALNEDGATVETVKRAILRDGINYLNRFFAVVLNQNKTPFLVKSYDPNNKYPSFTYKTEKSVKLQVEPAEAIEFRISNTRRTVRVNILKEWMKSLNRLEIERTVMKRPEDVGPKDFNLWRGYDIDKNDALESADYQEIGSRTGRRFSIETILYHFRHTFCGGSDPLLLYVIRWLAHILQNPFVKTSTSLFIVSEQGVGKDLLFNDVMRTIIGKQHFLNSSDINEIAGHFTSSLEGKLYAVIDEVDKVDISQLGKLKSLITEERTKIEPKGVNPYTVDNHLNLVMTSNMVERRVFNVGSSNRRFVMMEANSEIRGDHDYFSDLADYLGLNRYHNDGGYRGIKAFAHFLYELDINGFNPRDFPRTNLNDEMKLQSMNSVHHWWYDCLFKGNIDDADQEQGYSWIIGDITIDKNFFYRLYRNNCRGHTPMNVAGFWSQIKRVLQFDSIRPNQGNRLRQVIIPQRDRARSQFQAKYEGADFDWDVGQQTLYRYENRP